MNNTQLNSADFKLKSSSRNQIEFHYMSLDQLVPDDHKVRTIWDFVSQMDLTVCLKEISSMPHAPGRAAIDPKIILTLWIYSILDGNASARKLEELCLNHDVYKWICGGVTVSRTVLAEFRSKNPRKFDELLTQCLAVMVKNDLISDTEFAQDGTRVKANAGLGSYRREKSLKCLEAEIAEYIDKLREEEKKAPGSYERRIINKKTQRAEDKREKIKGALQNLELKRCEKIRNGARKCQKEKPTQEDLDNVRASTTDPEARKMKMGDGGYRMAFNVQFSTGFTSRTIFGVDVVNTLDPGTAVRLMTQVSERLLRLGLPDINKWIADAAYSSKNDIIDTALLFPNCLYYAPPKTKKNVDPKKHLKTDHAAVKGWRELIDSDEIKDLYKLRCSSAEFSNMHVKNQALDSFSVRGLLKAKGMATLHAISMNFSRVIDLLKKIKDVTI